MKRFTKVIPKTEIEQLITDFPNFDKTKLRAECDTMGNIIFIETDNTALKAKLLSMGFTES